MTNRPTWNPAPPTGFHQLCRFSPNVKETEMLLVKTCARPHRARDTCGGRVLFSFSAKINVICEMLEGVTCHQGNGTDSGYWILQRAVRPHIRSAVSHCMDLVGPFNNLMSYTFLHYFTAWMLFLRFKSFPPFLSLFIHFLIKQLWEIDGKVMIVSLHYAFLAAFSKSCIFAQMAFSNRWSHFVGTVGLTMT